MLKDPRSLPPKYSNLMGIQTPISSEVEKLGDRQASSSVVTFVLAALPFGVSLSACVVIAQFGSWTPRSSNKLSYALYAQGNRMLILTEAHQNCGAILQDELASSSTAAQ